MSKCTHAHEAAEVEHIVVARDGGALRVVGLDGVEFAHYDVGGVVLENIASGPIRFDDEVRLQHGQGRRTRCVGTTLSTSRAASLLSLDLNQSRRWLFCHSACLPCEKDIDGGQSCWSLCKPAEASILD